MTTRRLVTALTMLVGAAAFAGWAKGDGATSASFSGTGPMGFKIDGKTKAVDVKDDGKVLSIVVNLKDLDTGISLRDRHMREKYLEVEKFPEAKLDVPVDSLKVPEDGKSLDGEGKGTFSVHGQSKEITFKYKATCKAGVCDVEGQADINYKDYGINVPSYMGVTVKPELVVKTTFQVKKG